MYKVYFKFVQTSSGFVRQSKGGIQKPGDEWLTHLKGSACCRSGKAVSTGFTLVELLVVIFISALLLIGLFGLYGWHSRTYTYQQAVVGVTEQSRFLSDTLQTYAGQARRVLATSTLDGIGYISTTTSVVLQLPVLDNTGRARLDVFDAAVFFAQENNLYFKLRPDAESSRQAITRLLADSVFTVLFTYDNPEFELVKTVKVELLNRQQTQDGTIVNNNLMESINLKNY